MYKSTNVVHILHVCTKKGEYRTCVMKGGKGFIRVITKLSNSEQSYKGKVKTHKYIDRQNQSTTGKL